jgi:hypothetical protein
MSTALLGADVLKDYDTLEFPLGTQVTKGQTTYEFVAAASAITAYSVYIIDEAGDASTAFSHTAAGSGAIPVKLGIPQVSLTAGNYGWVARQGKMKVTVLASCAKDVKLYSSATGGALDDASSSQTLVPGFRIDTTDGGSGSAIYGTAAVPLYAN